jgi:hypothetical protein
MTWLRFTTRNMLGAALPNFKHGAYGVTGGT